MTMYNNRWITLASLFLFCCLVYNLFHKSQFSWLKESGYSPLTAQYNLKIDPTKPDAQKTFSDKILEFVFKDRINSLQHTHQQTNVAVKTAKVGDTATFTYTVLSADGQVNNQHLQGVHLYEGYPLNQWLLGMKEGESKTINLVKGQVVGDLFTITGDNSTLYLQLMSLNKTNSQQ